MKGALKLKRLSNIMLLSGFLSTVFYSMSYPYIYAETVKYVSRPYLTFEQVVSCLGVVLFSLIWNKYGDKLFKHYPKIVVLEVIADSYLFLDVIVRGNLKFYFVLNILIYSIITRNITCGFVKIRAKVNSNEKDREKFDNNTNTVEALATITGAFLSIVTMPTLKVLFILALIGGIIDNFFYLYVYQRLNIAGGKLK